MLITAGLQVPVILLFDVVGNAGAVLFWHNGPICVNVDVICDVIATSIVVVVPHWPAFGVKVYVVVPMVEVLIVAGLHVPVMPLFEVAGNAGAVLFWHNGPICVNVGVIWVEITTSIVITVAHCPAAGVKVYVVVPLTDVLMVAGLHVPVMPLLEVVGKAGAVLFWQSGPVCVNVGVTCGLTVTLSDVVVAHCPAAGVSV